MVIICLAPWPTRFNPWYSIWGNYPWVPLRVILEHSWIGCSPTSTLPQQTTKTLRNLTVETFFECLCSYHLRVTLLPLWTRSSIWYHFFLAWQFCFTSLVMQIYWWWILSAFVYLKKILLWLLFLEEKFFGCFILGWHIFPPHKL